MEKPIKVIVVGMGARAMIYAKESLIHPEWFRVVGVVDVNIDRIHDAQKLFHIPDCHCFHSVEELVSVPKFADAVINGTMDSLHPGGLSWSVMYSAMHLFIEKYKKYLEAEQSVKS